jgi:hypothetical protein
MDALLSAVTVFTKNRERLLAGDTAKFLAALMSQASVTALLSDCAEDKQFHQKGIRL